MSQEKHVELIEVDLLRPSPTQPRRHFNERALEELTNSMRQHGFAFGALLVRPMTGDLFEIVIGERRVRAAIAAEISKVPCSVRALSDSRVVELQLIENLQRSDLNPIEEADGYKKLLELKNDSTGAPLYPTVADAARVIGRDAGVVTRQLLLTNLDGEAREWCEDGRLGVKIAYLIARIPSADRRAEAAKMILHPVAGDIDGGVLSLRDSETLIASEFMRDLRRAPFDQNDDELLRVRFNEQRARVAGGACTDCPYKSANIPGISAERKNSCLNPACFDEKINADWARWQKKETDPERKRRALSRAECLAIFPKEFPDQPTWSSGLVNLDQYPASDDLKAGEDSPLPWRALIEGAEVEILVARDRNLKTCELVSRETALAAARQNGHAFFKSSDRDKKNKATRKTLGLEPPADLSDDKHDEWLNHEATRQEIEEQRKADEKKRSESDARERLVAHNCFDALRKKARPTAEFLRRLMLFIFASRPSRNEDLLKRYKLPIAEDIARNIKKWPEADLIAFIVEFILTDAGHNFDFDDDDRAWLKIFGVDYRAEAKRIAKLDNAFKNADKRALKLSLQTIDEHDWEKTDLVSGANTNYQCKKCKCKGVRYGLTWPPKTKAKRCVEK